MELVVGFVFIGLVVIAGYKKFMKTSEGKDCCK